MNSTKIEFELIAQDPNDNSWHVSLRASNGLFAFEQEFYAFRGDFESFATALCQFGAAIADEASFQVGADSKDWAYLIRLRAFLYSQTGKAALEAEAKNHSTDPYGGSARFLILTEVAALNQLGEAIERWLEAPWSFLSWPEPS